MLSKRMRTLSHQHYFSILKFASWFLSPLRIQTLQLHHTYLYFFLSLSLALSRFNGEFWKCYEKSNAKGYHLTKWDAWAPKIALYSIISMIFAYWKIDPFPIYPLKIRWNSLLPAFLIRIGISMVTIGNDLFAHWRRICLWIDFVQFTKKNSWSECRHDVPIHHGARIHV